MARIIPFDLAELRSSAAHGGEITTLERLKRDLGPGFTVYHGVLWSRAGAGRTAFGEIDFVVVNRDGRILVIEQKNGPLAETGSGLEKRYADGSRSVVRQIHRNVNSVKEKFRHLHPDKGRPTVDYLFYCPDHRVIDLNAAGLDPARIVDASKRGRLADIVADILGEGDGTGADAAIAVHDFFAQTFRLVPDVHAHIDTQKLSFIRANAALCDLIENIEMSPLKLHVKGTAGCGKTGIALRFYQRAMEAGKRPLLVCFNRSLRDALEAIVPKGGLVQTFFGLCATFLESRGMKLDYGRVRSDPHFWHDVQDRVIEQRVPEEWTFDSLVIDEAQDFDPDWFQVLRLFLTDKHDSLWLEDTAQNIRQTKPPEEAGFIGYRVRENYRSPQSIARAIRSAVPRFTFECASGLAGLGVGVDCYDDDAEQQRLAAKIVTDLTRCGFRHQDIALLTMRSHRKSALSGLDQLGVFSIRRFTGQYDRSGNQILSTGQLLFDSIGRFKGQQAAAVVLCDIDPEPECFERWERLLYCGMTRATVRLDLLVNGRNPHPVCDALRRAAKG